MMKKVAVKIFIAMAIVALLLTTTGLVVLAEPPAPYADDPGGGGGGCGCCTMRVERMCFNNSCGGETCWCRRCFYNSCGQLVDCGGWYRCSYSCITSIER